MVRWPSKVGTYRPNPWSLAPQNFIKISQNPNKVARDTQGLPTVPHNDFGGLNFKGLVSKYLLLMTTSPYKITFSKKNHEKNLLESEKTSNSALSGVVRIEIWSSFWFCVSGYWATALHVNEPACPILLYFPREKWQNKNGVRRSTASASGVVCEGWNDRSEGWWL